MLLGASAVTDAGGRLTGLLATILDLTEQRRLREHLRRSEAYHRGMIEAAADGLITTDATGVITDVTGQVCRLSGYGRDELVGCALADCFRDPDPARSLVDRVLAEREVTQSELPLVTSDRSVKRVAVSVCVFPGQDGLVASVRDVTEQAALHDRLAHERAYNRSIIEASANGLVISDLRHRITDVNGTMCQLARRSRNELIGTLLPDCFADQGAAIGAANRALLAGEVTNRELSLVTPGHSAALVNISILRDECGEAAGLLTSVRDIAEQARLSRDLAAQQAYARAIVESSVVGLFTVAQDGGITDVNTAACELTGHARHRLLGRRFVSLFADADAAGEGISRAFGEGHVAFLELTLVPAGRPPAAVGFYAGMFLDPRTGQTALIVAVRDITAEKATQEALHMYAQSLYGATTDALVITDVTGAIYGREPHHGGTHRARARGPIGRPVETCFTEGHWCTISSPRCCATHTRPRRAQRLAAPTGGHTALSVHAHVHRPGLQAAEIFASARDITERKKFEELQVRTLERAQDLDWVKLDFVSRISHVLCAAR